MLMISLAYDMLMILNAWRIFSTLKKNYNLVYSISERLGYSLCEEVETLTFFSDAFIEI